MAMTTITHVYSSYDKATRIVSDLEAADVSHKDISLVARKDDSLHGAVGAYSSSEERGEANALYDTAVGTGVLGGLGGLLAGLGLIAIPGFGPVVAAGWLAATLAGATLGTAAGAAAESIAHGLTHHGVSHDQAHRYAESVVQGGTLVSVKIDESKRGLVESIMGANDTGFTSSETVDSAASRSAG
jgi:hypothetical protein